MATTPKEQHAAKRDHSQNQEAVASDSTATLLRMNDERVECERDRDDQHRSKYYDKRIRWESAFHD